LGEVARNDAGEPTFHIHAHAIVDIENKIVDDWNEYASREEEEEEEDEQRHASPAEDWLLCTLPPSFALSGRAEPLAVVLNYTGQRLEKNRKFQMLRELCGPRFTADAVDSGR
jgi:hypothetical protein